ncbi:class I adenylate-forming enzyme family protein [Phreatobacter stygius]|uniref:Acyl--CoA ligase n=1 Tax=Phreatobacter stygius TaxID=1940610 RepID=A0A4D7BHB8_9HYPH|nr:class I adenylate-forming enzyme family protein [Phreatobacter stygius]QCI67197.1 acyl--CoA ligase [Phreatobacter stygius]
MTSIDPNKVAVARARTRALEAEFEPTTIGAFVTRRCLELGDTVAIEVFDRQERMTYAEVERASNRIGHALRTLGIAKGDRVAVMLPNRIAYPLTWLALAKIGAIHVPVNTRYTPREIDYVTRDSGARAMIIDRQFLDTFQAMDERPEGLDDTRVVVIDGVAPAGMASFEALVAAAPETSCLDATVTPDDLVNLQYTSGTTGFPKGCMLSHEYWLILSFTAMHWDHMRATRLLTAQPFFYMDPQWHLLKTFRLGGTLFVAPQLSASRYVGWVKQFRVDWCQFPLLATRQPEAPDDRDTALKQVAAFGWDGETCRAFKRRFGVMARESFGMTEIGLGTWMPPELDEMYDSASVGIDGPFRETSIRDEAGNPVTPGERGELWVRGRSILQGYWNKPEANADAFREGGWFRTGDVFEADANGFLWLVGRIKDMIRRSSENISAREVEAVVRELPEVEDCAAVAVPDPKRGEEVKIYIQLKHGCAPDDLPFQRVRDHCRRGLAAFKVPRYYALVDSFPRTVSNKIEKRNLIAGVSDLRTDAWDAEDQVTR